MPTSASSEAAAVNRVRVNGWDFHCELAGPAEGGAGADIVLVHGEIHGVDYWEHQIPAFAGRHRILMYERRGHHRTGAPEYGYSVENQTRDLEGLIAHFGLRRPVIVAVAFGTTIAVNYALKHPGEVAGLMMIAWSELHEALRYFDRWSKANENVVRILETRGREALLDYLRAEAGRSLYMVVPLDSPIREKCVRMFGAHPVEEYRRGMLEVATSVPDLLDRLKALELPVLGVCGEFDPFPDQPELLRGMKSFREAPRFAGASRFIQWEQPREFNALLTDFLASCARPTEVR